MATWEQLKEKGITVVALRHCRDNTCNHVQVIGTLDKDGFHPIYDPKLLAYYEHKRRLEAQGQPYDKIRFWVHSVALCDDCLSAMLAQIMVG